jgi:BlaI family penicillinase repressor
MPRGDKPEIPPPLELECLKVLWALGEANVHDVRQQLAPARPLAYTTVLTVLDRLARKGIVSRRKLGRSFLYTPQVSRDTLRRRAVEQLLENFFSRSAEDLRAYLDGRELRSAAPAPEPALDTTLL